jgi:hypothetical protein
VVKDEAAGAGINVEVEVEVVVAEVEAVGRLPELGSVYSGAPWFLPWDISANPP